MTDDALRIVLADDHDLFREGLRRLLENIPAFDIVGEAADGRETIRLVSELRPDVVLMDINMPRVDGLRATEYIVKRFPATHVVVLTMHQDDDYAMQAIRAGAKSYLLKTSRSDQVVKAIRVAAHGGSTIDPSLAPAVMREYQRLLTRTPSSQRQLNDRESTLLQLLAAGKSNRQMADQLELAESTVKNNLSALFQKIGVRDRTQAALYAITHGYAAGELV